MCSCVVTPPLHHSNLKSIINQYSYHVVARDHFNSYDTLSAESRKEPTIPFQKQQGMERSALQAQKMPGKVRCHLSEITYILFSFCFIYFRNNKPNLSSLFQATSCWRTIYRIFIILPLSFSPLLLLTSISSPSLLFFSSHHLVQQIKNYPNHFFLLIFFITPLSLSFLFLLSY